MIILSGSSVSGNAGYIGIW